MGWRLNFLWMVERAQHKKMRGMKQRRELLGHNQPQVQRDIHAYKVEYSHELYTITPLRLWVVPTQIMQILGHAGLRQIFANHLDDSVTLRLDRDDLAEGFGIFGSRQRHRARRAKKKFPDVPSEEGQILMNQGIFGTSGYYRDRRTQRKTSLAKKLMRRELGDDREYCTRAPSAISQVREISIRLLSVGSKLI